jgi:uncharacterized RDD family membrane protein YckC
MATSVNPYSPPASDVQSTSVDAQIDASKGRRFGTLVVDYVCYMLIAFLSGVVLGVVFGEAGAAAMDGFLGMLFGVGLLFVYYMIFEGFGRRTPGKFVFGTIVVTESGEAPTMGQIALRTICRFIPFEPFSFFGKKGWHDSISKTRVVMVNSQR